MTATLRDLDLDFDAHRDLLLRAARLLRTVAHSAVGADTIIEMARELERAVDVHQQTEERRP